MTDKKMFYIVEALRWGDRESHSYIVGLYSELDRAKAAADAHSEYRGGKYSCQVFQCAVDEEVDTDWNASLLYESKCAFEIDKDAANFRSILETLSKRAKERQ